MADSVLVWAPGVRLLGPDGKTLAGGRIEFYHAGTTSPYTVYADADLTVALGTVVYLDSGGYPIASQSDSTKVHVYVGIKFCRPAQTLSSFQTQSSLDVRYYQAREL